MREVKVVQEGSAWQVKVVDGERTQSFHCATQAQAEALSKVMSRTEDPGSSKRRVVPTEG
jgi:hypothetical protein